MGEKYLIPKGYSICIKNTESQYLKTL